MDWVTPDEVTDLTGVQVDVVDVERAQILVELFAGTTTDATDLGMVSSRNMRLLRWATAFQTVWMKDRPDIFTHVDVEGVSQDGVSAQYANANAALLAPLANRCIRRLSWVLHPLKVVPPRPSQGRGLEPEFGSLDDAVADDDRIDWVPYRT